MAVGFEATGCELLVESVRAHLFEDMRINRDNVFANNYAIVMVGFEYFIEWVRFHLLE